MIDPGVLVAFALVAVGMVCSPGPNMLYLISRSVAQGRTAGIISLGGVAMGFVVYMLAAACGLTALVLAVPVVYGAVKLAGAAYLLWLAWGAIKPGSGSVLAPHALPIDPPRRLFLMGFVTNLLNPKIAVLYLSLLPQFEDPARGSLLTQGLVLGLTQIAISVTVNLTIVLTASGVAAWFATRPIWLRVQRWLMATVLAGLALRLALDKRA